MCLTRSFPSSTQYWLEGQVEVVTELTYWVSLHIVVGGQSQSQTHFNLQPFLCRLGNEIAAEKIFLKISQMVRSFQQVICWQPRTSGKKQTPGKVFGNQRQGLGMQEHLPTNSHSKSQRSVKSGLLIHAMEDPRKQTLDKSFVT